MIDQLKYYPQFCMSAAAVTIVLLVMYAVKRNYPTKKNRIFFFMLIDNLLASLVNIGTFIVITFPERFPMWFCDAVNIAYLLLFNGMAMLFLLYIDSMTKLRRMRTPVIIIASAVLIYDAALLITSPFTHLAIYYNDQLVYSHGPLMFTLYLTALLCVSIGMAMFLQRSRKFNKYQILSVSIFVSGVVGGIIFQLFFPRFVINNLACALVLIFIYAAFENQAYYLQGETSCFNRRAFVKTIHRYMKAKRDYVLTAIRIEGFGQLLHSLGSTDMERLSERVAERLSSVFGRLAFSVDSNCFAIVQPGSIVDSDAIGKAVRQSFMQPFSIRHGDEDRQFVIRPEITVMYVMDQDIDGHEMTELMKKIGEHSSEEIVVVEDVIRRVEPIRRERYVLRTIDNAILNRSFEVYYQPILDVKTGKFVCSEALVRMKDEYGKFISPEEFIPIAEKSGRIDEVGQIVFSEVCRFIRDENLKKRGVDYIEINLSPEQCRNTELKNSLKRIMKEYGVSPDQVNLEITETARIEPHRLEDLRVTIGELHEEGLTFSLDDFGSGFAAINYLITLPVDIVKIDKAILWKAMTDEDSMTILRDTIRMVRNIGKQIVVEGIETEAMAELIKENGCDYLQGYYYSKPLPGRQYLEFIAA